MPKPVSDKPIIQLNDISKRFGPVTAVVPTRLDIMEGEFFALLGPSGCGKTTLLRMIAGFEIPSSGQVIIDGEDVSNAEPNKRPVNMVFQSYAVFPHMTVADNVGYGLKVTRTASSKIKSRVTKALELVQLGGYDNRMPDQLSGGQRQRVALARALVKQPKVLLLDEPLSALDAKLREAMQLELVKLQHSVGITFVIVTHNQDEALSMADRIAVMEAGKIKQIAPPQILYEYPNSKFVADFIGSMNLFEGTLTQQGDVIEVHVASLGQFRLKSNDGIHNIHAIDTIAVRPEKTCLFASKPDDEFISFAGRISNIVYHGAESHVFVTTDKGAHLMVSLPNSERSAQHYDLNQHVYVGFKHDAVLLLPK